MKSSRKKKETDLSSRLNFLIKRADNFEFNLRLQFSRNRLMYSDDSADDSDETKNSRAIEASLIKYYLTPSLPRNYLQNKGYIL